MDTMNTMDGTTLYFLESLDTCPECGEVLVSVGDEIAVCTGCCAMVFAIWEG